MRLRARLQPQKQSHFNQRKENLSWASTIIRSALKPKKA
jgi:hypothetical protein